MKPMHRPTAIAFSLGTTQFCDFVFMELVGIQQKKRQLSLQKEIKSLASILFGVCCTSFGPSNTKKKKKKKKS